MNSTYFQGEIYDANSMVKYTNMYMYYSIQGFFLQVGEAALPLIFGGKRYIKWYICKRGKKTCCKFNFGENCMI
jgi:hypothetical protein